MLDQSFSAQNFRTILDLENRKGVHVEDKLSMTKVRKINSAIKKCNNDIQQAKKHNNQEELNSLTEYKNELRDKKENELENELKAISQKVSSSSFSIELKKETIPGQKPIYKTPNNPENFFALKQIQRNMSRLFGIKQSNRHHIINQVLQIISDDFPKYIIRTDIKNFYESIDHKRLLKQINRDNLLTPFSRKILVGVINSYKEKSDFEVGVPRGIGVSAYLAELYMRNIDKRIRNLNNVTYYARYVDDIVVVFTPNPNEIDRNYLDEVEEIIESDKLKLNRKKTNNYDLTEDKKEYLMEYLGYRVVFGKHNFKVKLTEKKVEKYKRRLKLAFDHYVNYSKIDEKEARKILVKRIRFLTGNTKLKNNKKNILVGIYYSNNQLNDLNDLSRLDSSLTSHIRQKIDKQSLKERLNKYSFIKGFEEKRFSPFKTSELKKIMEIWSN